MTAFPVPEIKRVPLESIALTLKVVHNDVKVCSTVAISWFWIRANMLTVVPVSCD